MTTWVRVAAKVSDWRRDKQRVIEGAMLMGMRNEGHQKKQKRKSNTVAYDHKQGRTALHQAPLPTNYIYQIM